MTNTNHNLQAWISFLSYALTGSLIIVTGIVMGDIAKYFDLPISSIGINHLHFLKHRYFDLYFPQCVVDGNCAVKTPAYLWFLSHGIGDFRANVWA